MHDLSIEDFVPLTIEPKLLAEKPIWKLGSQEKIILSAEYFSGGAAAALRLNLITK